jgi:hypothetical protein
MYMYVHLNFIYRQIYIDMYVLSIYAYTYICTCNFFFILMFRSVESKEARDSAGNFRKVVKPYVMDLGSSHKTFINKKEIEDSRYYELREKDTLTFGKSERYIHLYM